MREKRKTVSAKNSLRTLILFCSVVFLLIFVSLGVKCFTVIKNSQFDGKHEFILGFVYQKDLDVVAFHPEQKTMTHLQVRGIHDLAEAERDVGIYLDSIITLKEPFGGTQKVSSYLSDALFKHHLAQSSLSDYDLFRLSLFAKSVPDKLVQAEEIVLPLPPSQIDQYSQELFTDETLSDENETVQIINGTGVSGLGSQLGRELSNRGVNVIAIRNADQMQSDSSIQYFGKETYSVKRLGVMLGIPLTPIAKQGLSDIIITIGTDKVSALH